MGDLTGDEYLKDDEHLKNEGERWVRHRLEKAIGPTRVTDLTGGPQGMHDLEVDLPGDRLAAIEITSEADGDRLSMSAAAQRYLSDVTVPGSELAWHLQLNPHADAKALGKPNGLVALLTDMEQQGLANVTTLSDYRNPWRDRLKALGIQSVFGWASSSDSRGKIYTTNDIVVGYGWVPLTADKWITGFFALDLGKKKLTKLARAKSADERHLAVLIHPDTKAGLGIAAAIGELREGAVGDELPTVAPPAPLTHLWLMAPVTPPKAFLWTQNSGWAVVEL